MMNIAHQSFLLPINLVRCSIESENVALMSEQKLEKKFGQFAVFVASTLLKNGDTLKSASTASLLKESHSCA